MGALGVSKGADLSLSLATFIPEVTAAISINGCISNVQSNLVLHDSVITGLEFDFGRVEVSALLVAKIWLSNVLFYC